MKDVRPPIGYNQTICKSSKNVEFPLILSAYTGMM